jgi:hypothetical protein
MSEIELTPAHFRALPILDPDEPRPMRSTIVLPPVGIRTQRRLRESHYETPAALLDLNISSLDSLRSEFSKLPAPPAQEARIC